MKKYDNYKDSGIEWLGEIPEHWESIKLKYIISIQSGKGITNEQFIENGEFDIYGGNGVLGKTDSYTNDGLDLIIGRVGALCGNIRLVYGKKWISDNALSANTTQNHYFIEKCLKVLDLNRLANKNAQPLITGTMVKDQYIGLPSIQEQTTIANYLDHKTTQIDTLIAKKEQFISLLQEERTAVINQAVTKGLDPKVKMKDSGIEWLGEIPEHWEVKKLKYLCNIINEKTSEKPNYVLALENIKSWTGEIIGNPLENKMEGDVTLFKKDDILFNKLRPYLAKVIKTQCDGGCVGELLVLRPNQFLTPTFLYYRMISEAIITIVDNSTYGTKMPRASWEKFISLIGVGFPSIDEQNKITDYIENKISDITLLLFKSQQEIELLKEYKTALISEVVTGKVDVREVILN